MESQKTLIEMMKKQIEIEKAAREKIRKQEKKLDNVAAKLLLYEMRLDTNKHTKILQAILDVIGKVPERLWDYRVNKYVDSLVAKRTLEEHMKIETEMLSRVEKEIKETKDEGIKLLLQHIAEDEKKHHKVLQTILERAYKIGP